MAPSDQSENSAHGGGFWHFCLCIALLVSSSIYLKNINEFIAAHPGSDADTKIDFECVPNLVPANSSSTSAVVGGECTNLKNWKMYAILGIVRGSLYFVQILGQGLCHRILLTPSTDPNSSNKGAKRRALFVCLTLVMSLFLVVIPVYLGFNLYRTNAIYSTVSNLAGPAMAMFVICILELLGLILFMVCCAPIIIGTACCAICCACCGSDSRKGDRNVEYTKTTTIVT